MLALHQVAYPQVGIAEVARKSEFKIQRPLRVMQEENIGPLPLGARGDSPKELAAMRRNIEHGLPWSAEGIIKKLEKLTGRDSRYRQEARPKKG